jgi:hypothetical protein
MGLTRKSWGPALAIAVGLALPGAAMAQSGAIPDPNSPAGKEYALPLDQGRGQGMGGSHGGGTGSHGGGPGSHGGSSGARPLFGAGIGPPGHHHARSSAGRGGTSVPGSTADGTGTGGSADAGTGSVLGARTAYHRHSGGQPTLLVLLVLLGGAMLAGGFRLVGRRSPPPAGA